MAKPKEINKPIEKKNPEITTKSGDRLSLFLKTNSKILLYLLIITILFVPVYQHIFDKKVALLGDNAAYYILGKAIANGDGFVHTSIISKPKANHFPPGYPTFIATVMKIFNDKITTIKTANGFLLWGSLIILFFFFRKISQSIHLSFIISIVLIFNMHLLQYSTWMMSEVPFIFISSLSLLLLTLTDFEKKPWQNLSFLMVIITAAASYYVKGQGLAIFAGILIFLLFEKKWLYAMLSAVLYFLFLLPWQLRNADLPESSYSNALKLKNYYNPSEGLMQTQDWFDRFFTNLDRYFTFEIPSAIFSYNADYQGSGHLFGGVFISIIIFYGFLKLKKYRWAVGGYVATTFGILFLWPEIWNGIRFILVIVPILTFLFVYGIIAFIIFIAEKLKIKNLTLIENRFPYVFLIFALLFIGKLEDLNKAANKNFDPLFRNYFALASWANKNLPDTAVVICRKPELFYLDSKRFVDGFTKVDDMKEFLVSLDKKKTTHIVVFGDGITQRYFLPVYEKNPEKFIVIQQFRDPDMWLLEYRPNQGYTGDWKNGMKEGQGIYCYPDGKKYEGEWKNNTMEGKGILYTPTGEVLMQGQWENGQYKNEIK